MQKRKTINIFIIIMVFIILGSEIVLATDISNSFNLEDFNLSIDTVDIDKPYISKSTINMLNSEIDKQIHDLSKLNDQELINTTELNQIINRIILNKSFILKLEYENRYNDDNNRYNIVKEKYIKKELSYFKDEMFAKLDLVNSNEVFKSMSDENNNDLINEAYLTDAKAQELIALYNSNAITENEKIKRFNDLKDSYNLDTIRSEEDKKQAIYQLGYSLDIYTDEDLVSGQGVNSLSSYNKAEYIMITAGNIIIIIGLLYVILVSVLRI